MMNRRILLTGGTGLVGTDILECLTLAGHDVYCISRSRPKVNSGKLTWLPADISTNPERILQKLPKVDYIVHAAAAVRPETSEGELGVFRRTNMEFTETLFRWGALHEVEGVIFISGFNILHRPLAPVIDEDHPVAPLTPYALSKYWGEFALARHASSHHFRGVALRVSSPITFSLDLLHNTVVKKWIGLARCRQPLVVHGRGTRTQDFVCTEDIAQAVHRAIQNPHAHGLYNIASGTSLSMLELATLVADYFGTETTCDGDDVNEGERWSISIDKARTELDYVPHYTSCSVISRLLKSIPL